ncbi:MAG: VCBS repeat-containing protein [Propionicimonas sp.]|uniref:FG-GAP repeat domain-containing protein n=1 Tax=Propionicimonas sp. TaxID=1955623 RepID=UPI003D122EDC
MNLRLLLPLVITGALLTGPSAPDRADAMPALPQAAASVASPDFDGDGKADVAFTDEHFPGVRDLRVRYGTDTVAVFTPVQVTDSDDGDLVGPLLAHDLNADGYTDLLMIAATSYSDDDKLYTLYGSASGLQLASMHTMALTSTNKYATWGPLAVVDLPVPRLVISVFSADGNSTSYRNLLVYRLDGDGLPSGDPLVLAPGAHGVPAFTGSGAFGATLASAGNQLFVGAPDSTVGGASQAGAVVALTFDEAGVSASQVVDQTTPGVGSDPEEVDWFGRALAAGDGYLVVGTPGEWAGKKRFVGSVQVFRIVDGTLVPDRWISQGSTGIPGKDEGSDQFGASVSVGSVCPGVTGVAIGASGETVAKSQEGSAWIVPLTPTSGCAARQLYQGHGLPGKAAAQRQLGTAVQLIRDQDSTSDNLVIAGRGYSHFTLQGRLFVWSTATSTTIATLDESPTSVAGR